jgi:ribonuclease P protein component
MLPSPNRLRNKSDFARVLKNGKSKNSQFLSLRFIGNDCPLSRLGLLVSKKAFKKANQRNRIKRKLREALRANLSPIRPGQDIIFIARAGLEKNTSKEMARTILSLLEEAGLVKDSQQI